MTNSKIYILCLLIILICSLLIRVYYLDFPFCSNDEALHQQFVIDSIQTNINSFFNFNNYGIGNPLRILVSIISITYDFFLLLYISLISLLKIPITETVWRLPIIIIGVINIALIYYFMRFFVNKKDSLITAAFFAIFPLHVGWSRSLANIMLFSLTIQLFALIFFMKYMETSKKKFMLLSSIFLALFILTDNFFPQFIVILCFIFLIYNKKMFESVTNFKKAFFRLFNWRFFFFPCFALITQLSVFVIIGLMGIKDVGTNAGMIGHILAKPKYFGIHLFPVIESLWDIINPFLFFFIIIMIIFGIRSFIKLKKSSILLFAGLIYALPFFFFLNPSTVNIKVYAFTSVVFFIMFSFFVLSKIKVKSYIKTLLLVVLFITTFISLFPKIYGIPEVDGGSLGYGGNLGDCGVKALGYWFRTNTAENTKVMVIHGFGIGPVNGKYYFHRKIYGIFGNKKMEDFFIENIKDVDYIIVLPENQGMIALLNENKFNLVRTLKLSDKKIFFIFSKIKMNHEVIDISKYNELYDKKFNKITDYLNAPLYVADSPAYI